MAQPLLCLPIVPAAQPRALAGGQALYFVSGPVDWAVAGGASVVAFVLLGQWGDGRGVVPAAVAILAPLCNWPHFAASTYRLYHTRENVRQYPLTALVAPFVVAAGMVCAFAAPTTIAPAFVKLMLLWSPYHFSGQSLGITLVYARRAGIAIGLAERRAFAGFIFTAFLAATAHAESGTGMRRYLGIEHAKLGLPPWLGDGLTLGVWAFGIILVGLLVRLSVRERRVIPPIVCLPAVAQAVWFVVGRHDEVFQLLVPFFHSVQYLFVAWAVQLKERMVERHAIPSRTFVAVESARWWSGNVVVGLGLFLGFPHLCAIGGYEIGFAMAITSAAVQLHHFFVDGVIWKLKNSRVSAPLLGKLADVARPLRAPAALTA